MKQLECILLVDDDPDDNYIHQLVITDWGKCNHVRVSENGTEALTYLSNTTDPTYIRPEVILLDINMPGMNGFEFLEEYHRLDANLKSNLVVMMLTTSLNPSDEQRAEQFNEVTGYRNKPLTKAMLDDVLVRHFS
ncbi:response regulator [Fibrella aquatica]|jgi:CheY-like chemotaxis protein|uniref:response regulator n=1 Tax=Fibrella aquatica TaxID=3242487 RepID=UPI0035209980